MVKERNRIVLTRREKRAFDAIDLYFSSFGCPLAALLDRIASLEEKLGSANAQIAKLRAEQEALESSVESRIRGEVSKVEGSVRKSLESAGAKGSRAFDFSGRRINEDF